MAITALATHASAARQSLEQNRTWFVERTIDFAATNESQNDVIELVKVKKGYAVRSVAAQLITAEGGALTCDIGDGGSVGRYVSGFDLNGTALSYATTYFTGFLYTADDTVDLKVLTGDADAAKVRVLIELSDHT